MSPRNSDPGQFFVSDARALSVVDADGCECPQPDKCVERLKLPPLLGNFRDKHGRLWTVLGRRRFADPLTGRVRYTEVCIRRFERDHPVHMTIRCAGPPAMENRYERNRPGRPPKTERLPFQPAALPGS